jgi:hypothetical protein
VAAAILAVVVAGLIVFLANRPDGAAQNEASSSTSAATSSAATSPTPGTSAEETTTASQSPTPTSTASQSPTTASGALAAKDIRDFLEEYHQAVLDDPRTAYDTMTGPTLRSNVSYDTYARFWGRFSDVKLSDIEASDGSTTATATMRFTENGKKSEEFHTFTLAVGSAGQLLLDRDEQTSR